VTSLLGRRLPQSRLPDIGKRELDTLEALWSNGALTAQTALEHMRDAGISLSTVQSTLERLSRKKLVERHKVGRSYVYEAAITKETIISRMMREIADSLTDGDTAPMVSGFLDYLDADPAETSAARKAVQGLGTVDKPSN